MWVAARVSKLEESPVKGSEVRVFATVAESGDRVGSESESLGELSASESKEEGFVVGDDFANTFKRNGVVSNADDGGVGEGLVEMEKLGHHSSDFKG